MEKITKQDPQSQSTDIVPENIENLQALFPEIITEGDGEKKIDFDALKEILGEYVEDKNERYSFTWHGKSRARRLAQAPSTGTLLPCKKESVDWDTTQNLFIEGDNLEVLKLLQKSYHKKVKMIYIDPPYNTGKEFIYPDKYQDNLDTYLRYTGQVNDEGFKVSTNLETSGRFHTNWLNMMYPRLKLAKNLLSDDGVIFISIGENEVLNLRHICNEIFGEFNFSGQITWKARVKPVNVGDAKYSPQKEIEYVLIYKKKDVEGIFQPLYTGSERSYPYEINGRRYRLTTILKSNRGANRRTTMVFDLNGYTPPDGQRWQAGKDEIYRLDQEGYIEFQDGTTFRRYFEDEEGAEHDPFYCFMEGDWSSTSEAGKNRLNTLVGDSHGFDTVKPPRLIQTLVQASTRPNEDDIVLDFFAGSCTTMESIFEQNVEDLGNRKFIAVQLPEPAGDRSSFDLVTDIGKSRIIKSSEVIKSENSDNENINKVDFGYRVYKLNSSNINSWDGDFETLEDELALSVDSVKIDRTAEDVLYEILLKYGLDLTLPIVQHEINGTTVYDVGMGALMVCLDDSISIEVVEGIGKLKEELQPEVMRVVFKDAGFADDVVKTNAVQVLKQFGIGDVRSI
ncbi:MAG: site-specific DNA-methyltransferase [Candidatus Thiodiazotropha sp. (ex. Lucinisca nassula)]|nr:site-specific DNA-methyltransferase [Candidatus Thiodiazotropha sp. (ex. Lucinisca nassula)]